jgi:hypothetical protein
MAMTRTDLCRGYLSRNMPMGISVSITGMKDEKYSKFISMELRLYGYCLRGA